MLGTLKIVAVLSTAGDKNDANFKKETSVIFGSYNQESIVTRLICSKDHFSIYKKGIKFKKYLKYLWSFSEEENSWEKLRNSKALLGYKQ